MHSFYDVNTLCQKIKVFRKGRYSSRKLTIYSLEIQVYHCYHCYHYYQYLTHAAPTRCCSCISYGGLSIPNEKKKTLYTKIKVCFKTLFVKPILAMLDHCNLISNQGLYVYQCCRANIFIYIFLSK